MDILLMVNRKMWGVILTCAVSACDAGGDGEQATWGTSAGDADDDRGLAVDPEPDDPAGAPSVDEIASVPGVAAGGADLTTTQWKFPMGVIALEFAYSHTCYIATMNGGFTADTDGIEVRPSGARWRATGGGNVGAFGVNCFHKDFAVRDTSQGVDGLVTWSSEGDPIDLGKVYAGGGVSRACFLTGLQGKLQGSGDAVSLIRLGGNWVLTGKKQSPGELRATAVCVKYGLPGNKGLTSEVTWKQGQAKVAFPNGVIVAHPCALTRVSGKFDKPSEWVGIWHEGTTAFLGGGSFSTGVTASGVCFQSPVFQGP